jgi:phospho-N-acetylmuramoyl-pentapeptide-transferase
MLPLLLDHPNSTLRALLAILLSFCFCLLLGPRFIAWLTRQKIGDNPNFDEPNLNDAMAYKKNTPTMGGVLIIAAISFSTLLLADLRNRYVCLALVCLVSLGALGAIDDWLKLTKHRRGVTKDRQGLGSKQKLICQFALGAVLGFFTFRYAHETALYIPFPRNVAVPLGTTAFVVLASLVLAGMSNAVNLTDGLDGLAAGNMAIVSFTFLILAAIVGTANPVLASRPAVELPHLPYIHRAHEMTVVAGALVGACLGFLWFNCFPAKVFMGDTGSLALGGLIAYIAIVLRQELLLLLVGGIFVAVASSVMLQVGWFKYTRLRHGEGRRIFLMAPLHHHFQKKGWPETRVVVRFWLITAMLAAITLTWIELGRR